MGNHNQQIEIKEAEAEWTPVPNARQQNGTQSSLDIFNYSMTGHILQYL